MKTFLTPLKTTALAVTLALAWLAPVAHAARTEETVNETFSVGDAPEIHIIGFNGSINVEGGSGDKVRVTATKYVTSITGIGARRNLDKIHLDFRQDGNHIKIEAKKDPGFRLTGGLGVRFEIEVPKGSSIRAQTSNGKIFIEDIEGPVDVATSNGSVVLDGLEGDIRVRTSNGSIVAEFDCDKIDVKTSNSSITLEGRAKEIIAHSSNGRVYIESSNGARVNASTSNGSISFEGGLAGDCLFKSSNGRVTLALPDDLQFEIDAATSNGRISSEFKLSKVTRKSRRHLKGRHGSSPVAFVTIRTSNSSIKIIED